MSELINELINIKPKNNRYKCEISSKDEFNGLKIDDYNKFIGKKMMMKLN